MDLSVLLTVKTSPVQTAGAPDVTMASLFSGGLARRIFCATSGTLAIKRRDDSAFVPYPVYQGMYLDGLILAVGGTGSGSTSGIQWIAEA